MSRNGAWRARNRIWQTKMIHKGTERVFSYWRKRRSGKVMPARKDIAPAGIAEDLHSTFILECSTPKASSNFSVRLAGTRLCAIFGNELRDVAFTSLFQSEDRMVADQCISAVRLERMVIVFELTGVTASGREVTMESMLLPLADRDPQMIFGTLLSLETPVWLGADPVVRLGIDTLRVIDHDKELFCLQNRPAIPIEANRAEFSAGSLALPGWRNWRLIRGGKWKSTNRKAPDLQIVEGGKA